MGIDFTKLDAQVWWKPTESGETFTFPVSDHNEAAVVLMVLVRYDEYLGIFLKGYTGGLRIRAMVKKDTNPEDIEPWQEWGDEEYEDVWDFLKRRYMFP